MSIRSDLIVEYGKKTIILNSDFLDRTKSWNNLDTLKFLYRNKLKLYSLMERSKKPDKLKALAKEIELNEYEIQRNFNFQPSYDYFRFWEMPHCSCPKLDNSDNIGTSLHYYSQTCILHGDKR